MQNFLYPVASVESVNFLEGLAQNATTAVDNLNGVPPIASRQYLIRSVEIITKQNFAPELDFFNTKNGLTGDPATDGFVGKVSFAATDGTQLGGSGLFRYAKDGLAIPYTDADTNDAVGPPTLHVAMGNTSATAKTSGAGGALVVVAWLEPLGTY